MGESLPLPPPRPRRSGNAGPLNTPLKAAPGRTAPAPERRPVVPVYFVSDSTGISAETMGNALLLQFPSIPFERHLKPCLRTPDDAARVREEIDAAVEAGPMPIVFLTAVDDAVREELLATNACVVDFVTDHLARLESRLGQSGDHTPARLHGVGDVQRYNKRMQAVEFAIEHDDGQSVRALERADVILIAPSRCGKTPTSMYLALTHGIFAANYPLVDEDFRSTALPGAIRHLADRCVGLYTTPERLSEIRGERLAASRYASHEQTQWELDAALGLYRRHRIPALDSSATSVEEMSTHILQYLSVRHGD